MDKQESISNILARRINAMGLSKQFNAAHICAAADKVEKGLRPDSAEPEFTTVSYKDGTLKIHVDSNARAHLIKLREKEIILKINTALKKEIIRKIVFEIA